MVAFWQLSHCWRGMFLFLQLLFRRLDYLGGLHGFLGLTLPVLCFSDWW